jgi:hypothetical protein
VRVRAVIGRAVLIVVVHIVLIQVLREQYGHRAYTHDKQEKQHDKPDARRRTAGASRRLFLLVFHTFILSRPRYPTAGTTRGTVSSPDVSSVAAPLLSSSRHFSAEATRITATHPSSTTDSTILMVAKSGATA